MTSIIVGEVLVIGAALWIAGVWFTVRRWRAGRRVSASTAGLLTTAWTGAVLSSSWYLLLPCGLAGCELPAAVDGVRQRTAILDRSGAPLGLLERDRSEWVPLEDFPPHLVNAVLQREDRRFWTHRGVDPVGTLRALVRTLGPGRTEGASTVAMQAVRCVLGELGSGRLPPSATVRGKLAEASAGAALLETLGRQETLELHLNCVPMGPVFGLPAAARYHFGRPVTEISPVEALALASAIRAPSRLGPSGHPDRSRTARAAFYETLVARGKVDTTLLAKRAVLAPLSLGSVIIDAPIQIPSRRGVHSDAAALLRAHVEATGPIVSTVDARLQARAWKETGLLVERLVRQGADNSQLQAAFVAISPQGEIRAYIAGRPDRAGLGYDRILFGRIRLASTLKPLLLAAALEARSVHLADTVHALPCRASEDEEDDWLLRVRERADEARTVRAALAASDNWLPLCLLRLLPGGEIDRLRTAGVPMPGREIPAQALGTGTLSPIDLTALYASFVNDGVRPAWSILQDGTREERPGDKSVLYQIPGIRRLARQFRGGTADGETEEEGRLWSSRTASDVRSALVSVVEEGTGRAALHLTPDGVGFGLKTGTATDRRGRVTEMVVVGFREGPEESLVGLLWVGHDEPQPIGIPGTAGRHLVPVWAAIMAPR